MSFTKASLEKQIPDHIDYDVYMNAISFLFYFNRMGFAVRVYNGSPLYVYTYVLQPLNGRINSGHVVKGEIDHDQFFSECLKFARELFHQMAQRNQPLESYHHG